jgi:hypothetical protein
MTAARAAFSRGAVAALVVGGFALFLALLFLLGRGESPLADTQNGAAHGLATGLNGYAGFARLLEAEGFEVTYSRSPRGLETNGILVLTPPGGADPQELGKVLTQRRQIGPTLVILPKWQASKPPANIARKDAEKFKRGWVMLAGAYATSWPDQLPAPFAFTHQIETLDSSVLPKWQGYDLGGDLPADNVAFAKIAPRHQALIRDGAGRPLAMLVHDYAASGGSDDDHWVIFIAEPDLANNFGMADPARAAAALAVVGELEYGDADKITFDLTFNGFGGSENLLTLAFRPPFLAATLCLILALAIVFWRAMLRFGPAGNGGPATGFGKRQLVNNGAGLILRARRFRLLASPYTALSARRLARQLGLARPDPAGIDAALAVRLPDEEPFTIRAARLEAATKPADILNAALAIDHLARKPKP